MKTLNLKRQNHLEPDITGLNEMLKSLRDVLRSSDMDSPEWQDDVTGILQFQDEDGSFSLLDSFRVGSDARVEYCYMPTYICSAILMKALLCDRSRSGANVEEALSRALKMCCGRGLNGHGYDSFRGKLDALDVFMTAGLREFILMYPDLCRDFSEMIGMISCEFIVRESEEDFIADWMTDFTEEIRAVNDYFFTFNVFVYGTLMHGEANHEHYLKDSIFLGKATIDGFEMYDVGSFPGIVPGEGTIRGELYEIPEENLEDLDCLEGEGSLYIRKCVTVRTEKNEAMLALVYVYNHSVTDLSRIP